MKALTFKSVFFFLFVGILITGCTKDDTPNFNASDLIGVWEGTSIEYSGTTKTNYMGQTIYSDFVGNGYDIDFTLTFAENPNIVSSDGSYSIELTYTTYGQSYTETIEDISFDSEGEWSLSGDKLSITSDGATEKVTIKELNDTTLKLKFVTKQSTTYDGATITTSIDMIVVLSKV